MSGRAWIVKGNSGWQWAFGPVRAVSRARDVVTWLRVALLLVRLRASAASLVARRNLPSLGPSRRRDGGQAPGGGLRLAGVDGYSFTVVEVGAVEYVFGVVGID